MIPFLEFVFIGIQFSSQPLQSKQPFKPEQHLLGDAVPFGTFVPNDLGLPVLGLISVDPETPNSS